MVGVAGIHENTGSIEDVLDGMYEEPEYETAVNDQGSIEIGLVHHESTDTEGNQVWTGNGTVGVLHGVVSNRSRLGWADTDDGANGTSLVERVLDRPDQTLAELDGPFAFAATDGDRVILATDRVGSRPLYFGTAQDGIAFGSSVGGILGALPSATLDEQAVSDLILLGSVWGQKTLAREVTSIPPGHVVEFEDGDVEMREYWAMEYGEYDGNDYAGELLDRYERAMKDVASTTSGRGGIWLSGGLDSRMMAGVLASEIESLRTFTYNRLSDPDKIVGTGDRELSPVIADHLGLDNTQFTLGQGRATEVLPACIDLVDGQIPWNTLVNLAATFELPRDGMDVVFEGSGHSEFFGEDVWSYHLDSSNFRSPARALLACRRRTSPDRVRSVLANGIDPMTTLRGEVALSDETRFQDVVMDANNRNLFSRFQFLSNRITQSQFGSRLPFANADLLGHLAKMPRSNRVRAVPFTRGKIPQGISRTKLRMIRNLDQGLDKIPYERSGMRPTRPAVAHGAGFVVENVVNRLASGSTFDRWLLPGSEFSKFVLNPLEDAADRAVFDRDAVESLAGEYVSGDPDVSTVAAVSTVERWASDHIDDP